MTLRGDRLQFLSNLNGDLVQEELLKADNGLPINLARDCTRNLNYLFTTTSIFQVVKYYQMLCPLFINLFLGDSK